MKKHCSHTSRGQTDPQAKFLARGRDHTVFLTASGAVLSFNRTNRSVRITTRGGRDPSIVGGDRQRAEAHYLIGADPRGWYSAETYSTVTYAEVYPGIDLVFHGHQQQLEYDFVIAAGRDPGHIALAIDGADRVALDDGDLVIGVAGREIRQHRALAYQDVAGERRGVDVEYVVRGPGELGFRVGAYDRSQPLVIDPVLTYATYLGGTDDDESGGIAVDAGAHGDGGTTSGTMHAGCGCRSGGAPDGGVLACLALGYLLGGRPRSRRVSES